MESALVISKFLITDSVITIVHQWKQFDNNLQQLQDILQRTIVFKCSIIYDPLSQKRIEILCSCACVVSNDNHYNPIIEVLIEILIERLKHKVTAVSYTHL